jgi:hypothetical protein
MSLSMQRGGWRFHLLGLVGFGSFVSDLGPFLFFLFVQNYRQRCNSGCLVGLGWKVLRRRLHVPKQHQTRWRKPTPPAQALLTVRAASP